MSSTATLVPEKGPIPAHLLGNMWAQSWENLTGCRAESQCRPAYDLTEILKARKKSTNEMVRFGERFFTSLGFAPLPKTFWERSLFIKPGIVSRLPCERVERRSRDDLRIKMCIDITAEDFNTIHHELGHNFYQRAYKHQPVPLSRQR